MSLRIIYEVPTDRACFEETASETFATVCTCEARLPHVQQSSS